jgi:hypothetical protein
MSDEYTPTTEDVALAWARDRHGWIGPEYIQPQFDRWLAARLAEAWDDGNEKHDWVPNPYRSAARCDECGHPLNMHDEYGCREGYTCPCGREEIEAEWMRGD